MAVQVRRMQVSEARKLKQLLADAHLDNAALQELLSKKLVRPAACRRAVDYLMGLGMLSQRRACRLVGITDRWPVSSLNVETTGSFGERPEAVGGRVSAIWVRAAARDVEG